MKKHYLELSKRFDDILEGSKTIIDKLQENNDYSLQFSQTLHSYKIQLKNKNKTVFAEKNSSSSDNKGFSLVEKEIKNDEI